MSVAFHPRYKENGTFFVEYTDLDGNTVISASRAGKNPDQADSGSERILLISPPGNIMGGGRFSSVPTAIYTSGWETGASRAIPRAMFRTRMRVSQNC